MQCANCGVWHPEENSPGWGTCHRHAPSPRAIPDAGMFIGHGNNRAYWPYTRSTDNCAEGMEFARQLAPDQNAEPPDKFQEQVKTLAGKPSFKDLVDMAREKNNA